MKRRIFIAISLPDDILVKLVEAVKRWRWLPIRWLKEENWHITIIPPFYADEKELLAVKSATETAVADFVPFRLAFDAIILAPPEKKSRMIWLAGPFSEDLERLRRKIESELLRKKAVSSFKPEERSVIPHVTLARFEEGGLRKLEQKTRILEELKLSFAVNAVDIVESHLKVGGAEYETLLTVPFAGGEACYEFLPHAADIRIKSRGRTLKELFKNSLLGMAEYMKKGAFSLKTMVERPIEVSAQDETALLIDFLSRTLTLADANNEVFPRVDFEEFSKTHLKGTLLGSPVEEFDEDIKAVTYHGAEIKKTDFGYEVTIIYDI